MRNRKKYQEYPKREKKGPKKSLYLTPYSIGKVKMLSSMTGHKVKNFFMINPILYHTGKS